MTLRRAPASAHDAILRAARPFGGAGNASQQIGRSEYWLSHCSNPDRPEMLNLTDAAKLDALCSASGGGTPITDWMRDHVDRARANHGQSDKTHIVERIAEIAQTTGSCLGECSRALRDGVVTPDEASDMLRELLDARAAIDGLIGHCRDIAAGGE